MRIYQTKVGEGLDMHVVPRDESLQEFLSKFNDAMPHGKPVGKKWAAPEVILLRRAVPPPHKPLREVDVLAFNLSFYVFNGRAEEVLGDMLRVTGQLLSLPSTDGTFFLYNPTTISNALDSQRKNRAEYVFIEEGLQGLDAFCLKGFRRLFVSDRFKARYDEHQLSGLSFYEVWSSESGPRPYWLDEPRHVLPHG